MIQFTRRALTFLLLTTGITGFTPIAANALSDYRSGDASQPYTPATGPFAPSETTLYQPLSGTWRMMTDKDESHSVTVPGCWPAGEGSAILSTTFRVPEEWADKHLQIVLWGARRELSIKINDRLVEAWESDWPTVHVDIPHGLLRENKANDLEIEVHSKLSARESIPLKPKLFDELTYAGLFGDVALVASPTVSIEGTAWDVRFSGSQHDEALWSLTVGLRNQRPPSADTSAARTIDVHVEWTSPDGNTSGSTEPQRVALGAVEIAQIKLAGTIRNPRLWTLDSPEMYSFRVVFEEGASSWSIPYSFGIRDLAWSDSGVLLNGRTVRIRGVNYRCETLQNGNAVPASRIEADLQRMKKIGFNLVRVVGEPPPPVLADYCDQLGLLLIPQTGLRGVPESLFSTDVFRDRVDKMLTALIERDGLHPSVVGWGVTDWAPTTAGVLATIEAMNREVSRSDKRPLVVGFASNDLPALPDGIVGIRQRAPYHLFEPLAGMPSTDEPWLVGGLGAFATRTDLIEDSVRGQIRQADATLHQLKAERAMPVSGFLIDGFADYRAALPLLIAGADASPSRIERGLFNASREERISWQKVGEALGQLRIEAPTLDLPRAEFPIVFPIATMIIGGFLLLAMRQNNVFRHNLQRVFAHTHGFFVDIRDRRYFQSGQTFLVALIFASSQAVMTASWLHHSRFNFSLDYLLTLLFPFPQVKALLVTWAWQPLQGIAAFTAFYFLLLVVIAVLIRIVALPFRGSISMRQSFSLVSWGTSLFILLIPLGLIHYRFLDYHWFNAFLPYLVGAFLLWFLFRLATIIRIGYRVTSRTAWIVLILGLVLVFGTLLMLYRSGFAITDYLEYYRKVILPWDHV